MNSDPEDLVPGSGHDETPNLRELKVHVGKDAPPREDLIAGLAVQGDLANAGTVVTFCERLMGEASITGAIDSLRATTRKVKAGDMGVADDLLIGQAVALNTIFGEMMRRAALNIELPVGLDLYMRVGLRAQSQCRATLESLAKIKNPPNPTFVKQANIAAGHQQVNNGCGHTQAQEMPIVQNELLEAEPHGEWMDTGATRKAGGSDPGMDPVEAVQRPQDGRGKKAV